MLIGLCGYAQSGKDEFYNAVQSDLTKKLSFAKVLKQEVQDFLDRTHPGKFDVINNVNDKKQWRDLLVCWGESNRALNANCWIDKLKTDNEIVINDAKIVKYITDVRYLNEAEWVLSNGGRLILIDRVGNKAANAVEERTISEITQVLRGKYAGIKNTGDGLNMYHMACRLLAMNLLTSDEPAGLYMTY